MKENVFRIYTEQLPKHLNIKVKYIDGYLVFGEACKTASFMFESIVYFKCTRPVLIAQTNSLIKYSTAILDSQNEGKMQDLILHINQK